MFKASWCLGNDLFGGIAMLRDALGMPVDAMDEYAAHVFVADENDVPIAAGRMYPVDDALRIDRIIVSKEFPTLAYEDLVLRILLYRARELPQVSVEVEPTAGLLAILPKFGFTRKNNEPSLMQCERESITWFSPCDD